jgi:energy-coupling factor transporter ATP-binding protein EcfA2
MSALGITEHADKKTKHLSGGTKRKLAFAIAILASPKVVLLDGRIFKQLQQIFEAIFNLYYFFRAINRP